MICCIKCIPLIHHRSRVAYVKLVRTVGIVTVKTIITNFACIIVQIYPFRIAYEMLLDTDGWSVTGCGFICYVKDVRILLEYILREMCSLLLLHEKCYETGRFLKITFKLLTQLNKNPFKCTKLTTTNYCLRLKHIHTIYADRIFLNPIGFFL